MLNPMMRLYTGKFLCRNPQFKSKCMLFSISRWMREDLPFYTILISIVSIVPHDL